MKDIVYFGVGFFKFAFKYRAGITVHYRCAGRLGHYIAQYFHNRAGSGVIAHSTRAGYDMRVILYTVRRSQKEILKTAFKRGENFRHGGVLYLFFRAGQPFDKLKSVLYIRAAAHYA